MEWGFLWWLGILALVRCWEWRDEKYMIDVLISLGCLYLVLMFYSLSCFPRHTLPISDVVHVMSEMDERRTSCTNDHGQIMRML